MNTRFETIEVEMWEWAKGAGHTMLNTYGLGPCIGVAVHDPVNRIGHLAHYVVPHEASDRHSVDDMFASICEATEDCSALNAWVRGGQNFDKEDGMPDGYTKKSRDHIIEKLKAIGIVNTNVIWNEDKSVGVDMELNCETGVCDITID